MITPNYVTTMARYNAWQNNSLYSVADTLDDAARRLSRGAFFGSIHGTLSHLFWGDCRWFGRFSGSADPGGSIQTSADFRPDWQVLVGDRKKLDATIIDWAGTLDDATLAGDLVWYSGLLGRDVRMARGLALTHFFNHQTHHRGQVHAMLTAAGTKPADTDLILLDPA